MRPSASPTKLPTVTGVRSNSSLHASVPKVVSITAYRPSGFSASSSLLGASESDALDAAASPPTTRRATRTSDPGRSTSMFNQPPGGARHGDGAVRGSNAVPAPTRGAATLLQGSTTVDRALIPIGSISPCAQSGPFYGSALHVSTFGSYLMREAAGTGSGPAISVLDAPRARRDRIQTGLFRVHLERGGGRARLWRDSAVFAQSITR